ncbi:MAG: carbohydrate esterase family 5 protein [Candidatus Saccharibacteria bacterium]|nr:carbohydrate esterase family 5 protein [Candidatus Saccharibacteria bacterium]
MILLFVINRLALVISALGLAVLAASTAAKAAVNGRTATCPSGKQSIQIKSFVNVGYRTGRDGYLVFKFLLDLSIPEGETVMLSSGSSSSWSVSSATVEPIKFEIRSYYKVFPRPPDDVMKVSLFTSCFESGTISAQLKDYDSSAPKQPSCTKYMVIDSRGSGTAVGTLSPPGLAFAAELKRLKGEKNVQVVPNLYDASGGFWSLAGAVVKLPLDYYNSVVVGKAWLRQKILKEANACREMRIFLTGYSQGAQVAADVYQEGFWPYVAGVALFGDPYFNHQDKQADQGNYQKALDGRLGMRPLFDRQMASHVLSYCHRHDPVCQQPLSYFELVRYRFTKHKNYSALGEPEQAARYLASG